MRQIKLSTRPVSVLLFISSFQMESSTNLVPLPHIALFPFMSKGHTIPLIHMTHLLHHRRLVSHITFFTTPLNAPFIYSSLSSTAAQHTTIIALPFPDNLSPDIPPGIESTDQLPSIELFVPFVTAMPCLRPAFAEALSHLSPRPSLLISDLFLGWTQYVATELGIPRLFFSGMGGFAQEVCKQVIIYKPHAKVSSPDDPFAVPGFPDLLFTKSDLEPPFDDPDPKGQHWDFVQAQRIAAKDSRGQVLNSFLELELPYFGYTDSPSDYNNYPVGPLCLARVETDKKNQSSSPVLQWLDLRLQMKHPVLYVSFGTQIKLSSTQMEELATGLEQSGLDFIWVMRGQSSNWEVDDFEERVGDRGMLVEWVDQMEVLAHKAVCGFISHCGWNSVMESLCAGVPILAWPMMNDQMLNAKFVVELRMGLRICASDGTKNGLVKAEDVERLTRELLVGEDGKAAKKKAEELAKAARRTMGEGGSSYVILEKMVRDFCVD